MLTSMLNIYKENNHSIKIKIQISYHFIKIRHYYMITNKIIMVIIINRLI